MLEVLSFAQWLVIDEPLASVGMALMALLMVVEVWG